ncbi:hypothetical protein BsWGS_10771 [Bradybaena similaris]
MPHELKYFHIPGTFLLLPFISHSQWSMLSPLLASHYPLLSPAALFTPYPYYSSFSFAISSSSLQTLLILFICILCYLLQFPPNHPPYYSFVSFAISSRPSPYYSSVSFAVSSNSLQTLPILFIFILCCLIQLPPDPHHIIHLYPLLSPPTPSRPSPYYSSLSFAASSNSLQTLPILFICILCCLLQLPPDPPHIIHLYPLLPHPTPSRPSPYYSSLSFAVSSNSL